MRLSFLVAATLLVGCHKPASAPFDLLVSDAGAPAEISWSNPQKTSFPPTTRRLYAAVRSRDAGMSVSGDLTWQAQHDGKLETLFSQHYETRPGGFTVIAADEPRGFPPGHYRASARAADGTEKTVDFEVSATPSPGR